LSVKWCPIRYRKPIATGSPRLGPSPTFAKKSRRRWISIWTSHLNNAEQIRLVVRWAESSGQCFDFAQTQKYQGVRSNNSTQGSSLPQQGPRGESFRRIKDHFSLGAPGSIRLTTRDERRQPALERSAHPTGMRADAPADHHPADFVCPPSGCLTIIVVQHSPQPLAAVDGSSATDA
jgi:hypothetical protein